VRTDLRDPASLANVGALKNVQTGERFSVLTETLKELRSIGKSAHDIFRGEQASDGAAGAGARPVCRGPAG
jgi:hypothetical protein